ncbi:MAG TPA: SRPBCC family protein [Blastocatellia bacterium]|nr:SRPBCC family protein [Blastocatellia bacterium]
MAIQQTRRALEPTRERPTETDSGVQQRDKHYLYLQRQQAAKDAPEERLANFLGWFSIGLGLAEVLAPKSFAKLIGAEGKHTGFIRFACGLREITAGVGILTNRRPATWVWARVAGDAMDLATLDAALLSGDTDKGKLSLAMAAVVGVTALDIYTAQRLSTLRGPHGAIVAVNTITINRPPEEVYRFWRNFENLPRFMSHLESVQVMGDKRSHWVAKAPAGMSVEWDAEIIDDRPNQLIAWRSLEGADVDNYGTVSFDRAPGGRGTEIRVEVEYNPPGGALGAGIAKLFGEAPEQQIKGDLRRLKQVLEIGEVVHSDSSIHTGPYPAQPAPAHSEVMGR